MGFFEARFRNAFLLKNFFKIHRQGVNTMDNLNVSNSPVAASRTTKSVMLDILIALAPATVAAIVLFGLKAAVNHQQHAVILIHKRFAYRVSRRLQHMKNTHTHPPELAFCVL